MSIYNKLLNYFGSTRQEQEMDNAWTNDLEKVGFTVEKYEDVVILFLGEEYHLVDYSFMWTVVYGSERKPPEWQLLFKPDQLIIDFSRLQYIDQASTEFTELAE